MIDVQRLLSTIDPCSLLILGLVLNVIGTSCCVGHRRSRINANRLGVAIFLCVLVLAAAADGSVDYVVPRLIQAGTISLCCAGMASILLPFLALIFRIVIDEPRRRIMAASDSRRLAAARRREEMDRQQRLQVELEAERHLRPLREQERLEQEQREEAEKQRLVDEEQRREVVRFKLRLLYDRRAAEIKSDLPPRRFEAYFDTYLSDDRPAADVEHFGQELEAMILDFFESDEPADPQNSMKALDLIEADRERVVHSDFDAETKASLLADLAWEQHQFNRKADHV